jgi:hypothetical protein
MVSEGKAVRLSWHLDVREEERDTFGVLGEHSFRSIAMIGRMTAKPNILEDAAHVHKDDRVIIDDKRERDR